MSLQNYDISFESLESTTIRAVSEDYNISVAQVKMSFSRHEESRNKIFGSYHLSTGIFAALSLISYFIEPESVPGRMGLLITLYLILINTYNSVDAPPKRGFSSVEIWFAGTQTAILLAILEYGVILGMKKLGKKIAIRGISLKHYKMLDTFTFTLALVYLFVFNFFYWYDPFNIMY